MKNKTLRTNSMKLKTVIAASLSLIHIFSSRWSFGLEKEKKGRTPKSPARNKKYSYVYLPVSYTHLDAAF